MRHPTQRAKSPSVSPDFKETSHTRHPTPDTRHPTLHTPHPTLHKEQRAKSKEPIRNIKSG
ncbi:MAG: hypothetical protein F6J93_37940 [Oscillatoria sp. SIO1A7]|nr:hypothetical protein [Oscillatoria sp. SIO1A7]